jgi:hypothetical protein
MADDLPITNPDELTAFLDSLRGVSRDERAAAIAKRTEDIHKHIEMSDWFEDWCRRRDFKSTERVVGADAWDDMLTDLPVYFGDLYAWGPNPDMRLFAFLVGRGYDVQADA